MSKILITLLSYHKYLVIILFVFVPHDQNFNQFFFSFIGGEIDRRSPMSIPAPARSPRISPRCSPAASPATARRFQDHIEAIPRDIEKLHYTGRFLTFFCFVSFFYTGTIWTFLTTLKLHYMGRISCFLRISGPEAGFQDFYCFLSKGISRSCTIRVGFKLY